MRISPGTPVSRSEEKPLASSAFKTNLPLPHIAVAVAAVATTAIAALMFGYVAAIRVALTNLTLIVIRSAYLYKHQFVPASQEGVKTDPEPLQANQADATPVTAPLQQKKLKPSKSKILVGFFLVAASMTLSTTLNSVRKKVKALKSSGWSLAVSVKQHVASRFCKAVLSSPHGPYVAFYKSGPTAYLGNFYSCKQGVELDGHRFNNSEAAFQWKKFDLSTVNYYLKQNLLKAFQACKNGEEAFQLRKYIQGHGGSLPKKFVPREPNLQGSIRDITPDWVAGTRDKVMYSVLQSKFTRDHKLMAKLQRTGDAYLLEHCPTKRDNYWSDNSDGTGKNMLGQMLMAIRSGDEVFQPYPAGQPKIAKLAEHFSENSDAYSVSIY